jgi:Fe-S-cluster-containing hydrogenase component 2
MGTHYIVDGCINCAACAEVCPVVAISQQGDTHVIDREICIDCGACDPVCPVDVIKWDTTA